MPGFKEKITKRLFARSPNPAWVRQRCWFWVGFMVLTLLLDRLLPASFWDTYYYRGAFVGLRVSYDYFFGYSPIPMIYLVAGAVLVRTISWMGQWQKGLRYQLLRAMGGVAAAVATFYILWGFNYHQISLTKRLGFDFSQVTSDDIRREYDRASASLEKSAAALQETDDFALRKKAVSDRAIRPHVEKALRLLGLPYAGRVRVRQLWPKGLLLRWNTAGIYIPQAGEGHIDGGLLSIQKPFTLAHEMAHGYGVTDEGVCNFIAWLACEQADDPWIRYGGALTYWKYVANEMPPDTVRAALKIFPAVVERSIMLVRENDKRYPDLFPRYRDAIYSSYLKHHGVVEGLRSYNEVVMMVEQYLRKRSTDAEAE